MTPRLLILSLALSTYIGLCVGVKGKHECKVDPDGDPLDPNNYYKCADEETCCKEQGLPTCCRVKAASDAAFDQFMLWGFVLLCIFALGFLVWYCRHDGNCCGKKSRCGGGGAGGCCCGGGGGGKGDSDDEDEDDDDDDKPKIEKVKVPSTPSTPKSPNKKNQLTV